jgi:hypothetical protein
VFLDDCDEKVYKEDAAEASPLPAFWAGRSLTCHCNGERDGSLHDRLVVSPWGRNDKLRCLSRWNMSVALGINDVVLLGGVSGENDFEFSDY